MGQARQGFDPEQAAARNVARFVESLQLDEIADPRLRELMDAAFFPDKKTAMAKGRPSEARAGQKAEQATEAKAPAHTSAQAPKPATPRRARLERGADAVVRESGTASINKMLRRAAIKDAQVAPFCMDDGAEEGDAEGRDSARSKEPTGDRVQGFALAVTARLVPPTGRGGQATDPASHAAVSRRPRRPGPLTGYTTFSADGLEGRVELRRPPPPRESLVSPGNEVAVPRDAPGDETPRNGAGGETEAKVQGGQCAPQGLGEPGGSPRQAEIGEESRTKEWEGPGQDQGCIGQDEGEASEHEGVPAGPRETVPRASPTRSKESGTAPGAKARDAEEGAVNAITTVQPSSVGRRDADADADADDDRTGNAVANDARGKQLKTYDDAPADAKESKAYLQADEGGAEKGEDRAGAAATEVGRTGTPPHGGADNGRICRLESGQQGYRDDAAGGVESGAEPEVGGVPGAAATGSVEAPSSTSAAERTILAGASGHRRKNRRRWAVARACSVQ